MYAISKFMAVSMTLSVLATCFLFAMYGTKHAAAQDAQYDVDTIVASTINDPTHECVSYPTSYISDEGLQQMQDAGFYTETGEYIFAPWCFSFLGMTDEQVVYAINDMPDMTRWALSDAGLLPEAPAGYSYISDDMSIVPSWRLVGGHLIAP